MPDGDFLTLELDPLANVCGTSLLARVLNEYGELGYSVRRNAPKATPAVS